MYNLNGGSLYMELRAMISGPWIMGKLFCKYIAILKVCNLDGGSLYMEVRDMISGPWIMWKLFRKYIQYHTSYCLHPRWWQPIHGGEGYDQWAMDHVEIDRKYITTVKPE